MTRRARLTATVLGTLGVMIAAVVALPFIAPVLGLAAHRSHLPDPARAVAIGGGKALNVYEFEGGSRGPIVLVHGIPGSGGSMGELAAQLAAVGFRAISYDRLGWVHASRRDAREPADPSNNARELLALVAQLQLETPVLLGYSYGGAVVQEANRLMPSLPSCNVLVASTGNQPRESSGAPRGAFPLAVALRWALAVTPLARALADPTMRALFHPQSAVPAPVALGLLAAMERSVDVWMREGTERFALIDRYHPETIVKPTLIVHGAADAIVPVAIASDLHRAIRASQLIVFEGAGHALPWTQADRVAKAIDAFATANCTVGQRHGEVFE